MLLLSTVFLHPEFRIMAKPAGLNFHTEQSELGVVELAKQQFDEALWPVHRLDKMTSGLLVLARSKLAAAKFQQLFSGGQIDKYYLAVASAKPKKKQGLVKGDMQKSRNGCWKLSKSLDNPAITQFFSYSLVSRRRLFLLKPKTGRTHQLRVVMKSLGAPILGDQRYGGDNAVRGYLHAYALVFNWYGERIELCSSQEMDNEFELPECSRCLDRLGPPWQLTFPHLP